MNTIIFIALILTIIFVTGTFGKPAPKNIVFETIKVVDGDSILADGERCRLYGIDAPEWTQEGGPEARDHLFQLIREHRPHHYILRGHDPYGRHLITLIGDNGADLNAYMVSSGNAIAYTRYTTDYLVQQKSAQNNHLGIWARQMAMTPEQYRHRQQH